MLILFLVYALIPLLIIIRISKTTSKKILWYRFCYAIPALVLTIINITCFLYTILVGKISVFEDNPYAFLIPGLLLALVLIVWNSGRRMEKILQLDIASEEIERVRLNKDSNQRRQIVISPEPEEIEKL